MGKSSSDDEEEVYVVEAILADRPDKFTGQQRYLIKWKDYSEEDNTWEPASNLNCPDLLAAYKAKNSRKASPTKAQAEEPKTTKARRKSVPTDSKSKTPKTSTRAPNGKGKSRSPESEEDEESGEGEASIAELDARRAEAKKKAAKERRASASRAEDVVAAKWEKKKSSKDTVSASSEGQKATKKPKEAVNQGHSSLQGGKSPLKPSSSQAASPKTTSKRPLPRVDSDSDSDDGPPLKRSNPSKPQSVAKSDKTTTSSTTSTTDSKSSRSALVTTDTPSHSTSTPSSNPSTSSATTAIRAMQFKRKAPTSSQQPGSTSNGSDEVAPRPPSVNANSLPSPEDAPPLDTADTTARSSSTSTAKPTVRFADDHDSTSRGTNTPQPSASAQSIPDAVAAAAAVAVQEAEARKTTLANLESRLTSSEYYRRTPIFQQRSMAAACSEAVQIGHGTVLRMKGRGVAIICDSRDQMVSGEGIALGLLLMMIGAKMPKQLGEVAVVCVHRRETLAPIEKMYNELVNMKNHHVEFLHFGDGIPVQPILVSGFLIMPSLSALQQGMAVESFCSSSHEANVRNCTVIAHPASIVLARSRLPQWQKIANTLGSSNIPIADKHELSLSSPFVNIDKNSYLAPGQTNSYLPPVTSQSEIAEITSLLCWKREQEPAKWRRFVIVVDQVDSVVAETAKDRGIELCTWVGLTEMTRECLF